jgi:hypothetical protein
MICPAYQSAFIYDKPSQKEAFSYYNSNKNQALEVVASNSKTLTLPPNDSSWSNSIVLPGPALPKEKKNKRTRYLLLPEKTYKKALRALQTVQMKPVYPKKQIDSVNIKQALDSAARSITDTLTNAAAGEDENAEDKDSTYVISIEKEKFNVDQDNYMWYFRSILVLPDVRIAIEGAKEEKIETEKGKGFFKNLFKKKDKKAKEPKEPIDVSQSEEQVTDSTGNIAPNAEVPAKKKRLFGLSKKKSKGNAPPKAIPKKEEEEKF